MVQVCAPGVRYTGDGGHARRLDLQVARVRVLQGILHRCAGIGSAGALVVGCPAAKRSSDGPPRAQATTR